MNKTKLSESIEIFKQYYLGKREYYDEDEREWKVELCDHFQRVFAYDNVTGDSFVDSLRSLFEDSKVAQLIILLGGGSYFQYQRFKDLLESRPSQTLLSKLFCDLFFSRSPIKSRINRFKKKVDSLYESLPRKSNIQLNLISQFLGLCLPNEYYIYKSTEFRKAAVYFEYKVGPSDTSAGGTYEYFHKFSKEIKFAMNEAGLNEVDFIDVQTFIFREDWYSPANLEQQRKEFEEETTKLEPLPIEKLVDRVKESKPIPAKVVRGVYYYRNPNIAALVRSDASGVCDLCGKKAPFKNRAGKPYLECHHIVHLAENGRDEVKNCVALCPNCHAKMHVLNLESDKKKLCETAKERYERLFLI
jgi:hypothetical protein